MKTIREIIRPRKETEPWNKGKIIGQKPPLLPKHVWAIRTKHQMEKRKHDLALFNLAIDSKTSNAVPSMKANPRSKDNRRSLNDWIWFSRRDDCLDSMVPSDLRDAITVAYRTGYPACIKDIQDATNKPVFQSPSAWPDKQTTDE